MTFTMNAELHPGTKSWRPTRIRYWYESIIDQLLIDPSLSQREIARRLGRSEVTIGTVMNSDILRALYEQRRTKVNAELQEKINSRLLGLAIDAIDITHEKLKLQRDKIPFEDLVDVTDKTLTRLGYGTAKAGGQTAIVVNNTTQIVAPVSTDQLEAAREKFLNLQRAKLVAEPALPEGESAPSEDLAAEVEKENVELDLADAIPPGAELL